MGKAYSAVRQQRVYTQCICCKPTRLNCKEITMRVDRTQFANCVRPQICLSWLWQHLVATERASHVSILRWGSISHALSSCAVRMTSWNGKPIGSVWTDRSETLLGGGHPKASMFPGGSWDMRSPKTAAPWSTRGDRVGRTVHWGHRRETDTVKLGVDRSTLGGESSLAWALGLLPRSFRKNYNNSPQTRFTAYQYWVLLFCLALSPSTFTKYVDAALAPLLLQGICIMNYIDDWLILALSHQLAVRHRDVVLAHMKECAFSTTEGTFLVAMLTCLGNVEETLVPVLGSRVGSFMSSQDANDRCLSHGLGSDLRGMLKSGSVEGPSSLMAPEEGTNVAYPPLSPSCLKSCSDFKLVTASFGFIVSLFVTSPALMAHYTWIDFTCASRHITQSITQSVKSTQRSFPLQGTEVTVVSECFSAVVINYLLGIWGWNFNIKPILHFVNRGIIGAL